MPIAALRAGLNPRPSRKVLARTALKDRTGVRHMAPISVRLTLTIGMPKRAIHTASRHPHGAGQASSAISSGVRLAAGRNGELLVVPAGRRLGKGRAWPRLVTVMRSQNEELERIEGVAHRMADVSRSWSSGERKSRVGSHISARDQNEHVVCRG